MLRIKRRFNKLLNQTHPLCPPLERGMKGGVYFKLSKTAIKIRLTCTGILSGFKKIKFEIEN